LICNGATRWDGADGRYNNLISMGIGSGVANSYYTPPNLFAAFLRGTGTSGYNSNYVGPGLGSTTGSVTLNHGHGLPNHAHETITGTTPYFALQKDGNHTAKWVDSYGYEYDQVQGGVDVPYTFTSSTTSNFHSTSVTNTSAGSGYITGEMRPFNYGVQWIIKL